MAVGSEGFERVGARPPLAPLKAPTSGVDVRACYCDYRAGLVGGAQGDLLEDLASEAR